jgi:hypothetical protein
MVFEHIIKLQQEYTDKFVVVSQGVPELSRFQGMTGTVRTVNMSGRALVEFDGNLNIGWYDIDIDFLKVIDAPLPKEDPKAKAKAAPKAPAKKKAAKPAASAGGSVADVLAAARGEKASATAAPAKPAGGAKMSVAEMLAAARTEKSGGAAPATKVVAKDARKMSVEEMMAAARGEKSGGSTATVEAPAEKGTPAKEFVRSTLESARRSQAPAKAAPAPSPAAKIDRKTMSVEDMLSAARAEKSGAAAPAPPAEEEAVAEPVAPPEPEVVEPEVTAPEPIAEESADEPAADGDVGSKRDEITSVEDQVAYCRQVDG